MVYEKANSVGTEVLDAPAWLHKFIIGRKGSRIRELTQDMPKVSRVHLCNLLFVLYLKWLLFNDFI